MYTFVFKNIVILLMICHCDAGRNNDWDRHQIACHTTDYICFRRQYKWLRDHALLGNEGLGIPSYEPYEFIYGDTGTCVRISGVQNSELVGISINSNVREYFITLSLPLMIQQVKKTEHCEQPKHDINTSHFFGNRLHTFVGNATVYARFPYLLAKANGTRLDLLSEDLEVVLDIADLSQLRTGGEEDEQEYYASEWAYNAVQHFDAAEAIFAPYMDNLRKAFDAPLKKYILLYPEEEYNSLMVAFDDVSYRYEMCRNL